MPLHHGRQGPCPQCQQGRTWIWWPAMTKSQGMMLVAPWWMMTLWLATTMASPRQLAVTLCRLMIYHPPPPPPGPPAGAVAMAVGDGVPDAILGQRVQRILGRAGGGYHYHARIGVRCNNAAHGDCGRTRSTALLQDVFGPRAAEYYLATWLSQSDRPADGPNGHRAYKPTVANIRAYLDG